jgi:uncharacterized protein YlbG (UPF0298 family)
MRIELKQKGKISEVFYIKNIDETFINFLKNNYNGIKSIEIEHK